MTTGTPEQVTAGVRAYFDVVLPLGILRERGHRGDGLGLAAIDGEHVLFDAGRHFPEDMPVSWCRRPYAVLCHG